MARQTEVVVTPQQAGDFDSLQREVLRSLGAPKGSTLRILRRSIDARHRQVRIRLWVEVSGPGETPEPLWKPRSFDSVAQGPRAVVVGAGPAGLFAALRLLECGVLPIVLERGKDVRSRRRDLVAIHRAQRVDPDSNYCFGEGGAGTYSDGKLYTRSTKRGDVQGILQTLVQFGAPEDILVDAHPHIGTNKLPGLIAAMREMILHAGGEVRFDSTVEDIETDGQRVCGVRLRSGERVQAGAVILATGHSARDVFHLFVRRHWQIAFKPFALGVRVEHPQEIIDRVQYHCDVRPEALPAAAYSLVHQGSHHNAFSFCMCPGGIIAPCATAQEEVVTNGWSPSKRNNPWANSGIVVPVGEEDVRPWAAHGALAGLAFQAAVERSCWEAAGATQRVPGQRLVDFVEGRMSATLPECSYQPGVEPARLDRILPPFISSALKEGFQAFGKKMKGYYTGEAIVVGPESRTSSPVRIPRDPSTLMHPEVAGLFPAGEGAGYAGGIVSAAMDGERIAWAAAEYLRSA